MSTQGAHGSGGCDDIQPLTIEVCILTRGDRPTELRQAVDSARRHGFGAIRILNNGGDPDLDLSNIVGQTSHDVRYEMISDNLGIPGGREHLARTSTADLLFFLDDDARVLSMSPDDVSARFRRDARLAVISCRLVDEDGVTARYFVPVAGDADPLVSRPSATFLGGASIIRRSAMEGVGGYWGELFYSHEETDLSWRLYDAGYVIEYDAEMTLFHPRGEIDRHRRGWEMTGRNRVMIARRGLPWPIAMVHTISWLFLGLLRAPSSDTKQAYLAGWWHGWKVKVERSPIRWATVRKLGQVGRLPVI